MERGKQATETEKREGENESHRDGERKERQRIGRETARAKECVREERAKKGKRRERERKRIYIYIRQTKNRRETVGTYPTARLYIFVKQKIDAKRWGPTRQQDSSSPEPTPTPLYTARCSLRRTPRRPQQANRTRENKHADTDTTQSQPLDHRSPQPT